MLAPDGLIARYAAVTGAADGNLLRPSARAAPSSELRSGEEAVREALHRRDVVQARDVLEPTDLGDDAVDARLREPLDIVVG